VRIRSWSRASLGFLVAGLKLAAYSLTSAHLVGFVAFLACAAPVRAQSLTFTHFAGSVGGFDSIDASGSAARFNTPGGVAVDSSGNVYVADTNSHTIRKITPIRRLLAFPSGPFTSPSSAPRSTRLSTRSSSQPAVTPTDR
jgi:NHL repeat